MKIATYLSVYLLPAFTLWGCGDFLDVKPEKRIAVPETVEDLTALLDNVTVMNQGSPGLSQTGSDDFLIPDAGYQSMPPLVQNTYVWKRDMLDGVLQIGEWNIPYNEIFVANVVLEGLDKLPDSGADGRVSALKGAALFYRGHAYHNLLLMFAAAYDPRVAGEQLGVPLRRSPAVGYASPRSSLLESYAMVLEDLERAASLLPESTPFPSMPDRAAAFGMLARTHLAMGNWAAALAASDNALAIHGELLDYNTLDVDALRPFSQFNREVVYHSRMVSYAFYSNQLTRVNPELYGMYAGDDLRKRTFFWRVDSGGESWYNFKGTYNGDGYGFGGLTSAELLLIRAECLVREGKTEEAMETMDALLRRRYATDTWPGYIPASSSDALSFVLDERRKELVGRGIRWSDLKRLNREGTLAVTLERNVEGTLHTLPPDDPRYVLLIPENETGQSGIAQNPR